MERAGDGAAGPVARTIAGTGARIAEQTVRAEQAIADAFLGGVAVDPGEFGPQLLGRWCAVSYPVT